MATTATTAPNEPVTYTLLVIFTVDPRTHEHLQDQQAIRNEAHGWLATWQPCYRFTRTPAEG